MSREDELKQKIKALEDQIEPLENELRALHDEDERKIEERIRLAHQMKAKFELDELEFSAFARCVYGAGLAYPKKTSVRGAWDCSAILTGTAERGSTHEGPFPFAFYSIKSEDQPSANGATTRPQANA